MNFGYGNHKEILIAIVTILTTSQQLEEPRNKKFLNTKIIKR